MATKINRTGLTIGDKQAMKLATMACWWPSYPRPGAPCWSGIANELWTLAKAAEERADWAPWRGAANEAEIAEAHELARLAALADKQT